MEKADIFKQTTKIAQNGNWVIISIIGRVITFQKNTNTRDFPYIGIDVRFQYEIENNGEKSFWVLPVSMP